MIRFAAIGTASTGKSAVLNAVFGTSFTVDPRAGATRADTRATVEFDGRQIEVIDTPPLERLLTRQHADAYLLVCDKDLIDTEHEQIVRITRPAGVAVNKSDVYTQSQMRLLLQQIRRRLNGIVPAERIVPCSAEPVRIIHRESEEGHLAEVAAAGQPELQFLMPLVRALIAEADASLRVRTRTIAMQTRDAAISWLRERTG
jgi:predicted GTPase